MGDPNLDLDYKKEMQFPITIYMDFNSYFKQPPEIREMLDTAVSYAVSAAEMRFAKKSLSIIAAFTAVETMVNLEFKEMEVTNCETC